MRTNIDIDEKLMEEARKLSGLKTKRAVVNEALKTLIQRKRRLKILDLAGKIEWAGNIDDFNRQSHR